ncbi:MAG: 2Fe-2S iron-sulfur cluster-binding protein [Halovenus sp.]
MPDVTLVWRDGREETLALPSDETVLDAAKARDIGLPYGCRTGACGTCVARLLEGDLEFVRPQRALKERHRDEGYVLTCIGTPVTDCRLAVGSHHQAEMMSTPWK